MCGLGDWWFFSEGQRPQRCVAMLGKWWAESEKMGSCDYEISNCKNRKERLLPIPRWKEVSPHVESCKAPGEATRCQTKCGCAMM